MFFCDHKIVQLFLQDFFTLMMKNNSYVLTFSLGGPRGTGGIAGNVLTLVVCCATPNASDSDSDSTDSVEPGAYRLAQQRGTEQGIMGANPPSYEKALHM